MLTSSQKSRHVSTDIQKNNGIDTYMSKIQDLYLLMHAKLSHTYAAARRLSGMPRGLCYVGVFSVSDLFEPP